MGAIARLDAAELGERAMWSAVISALPQLVALFNRLIALINDNRLITLGQQQATERASKRQSDLLTRARTINNSVATRHRRHADDSAFDSTFEREDDV